VILGSSVTGWPPDINQHAAGNQAGEQHQHLLAGCLRQQRPQLGAASGLAGRRDE
jgi:hypothetical protein